MRDEEMNKSIAHRVAIWAAIVPLSIYVLNMGMWVGAADEKFENANKVARTQEDIKRRLTTLETEVKANSKASEKQTEAIIKAIEKLEKEIKDNRDNG